MYVKILFNINEGLGLLKLANTLLIFINHSPSNVNCIDIVRAWVNVCKVLTELTHDPTNV